MINSNHYDASKAKKASIIRYSALVLVIVNAVLEMLNMPIIPLESSEVVSASLITVVGLFVGFRNNYLTKKGERQAEELSQKNLLK